jgi:hypothetical protein
MATASNTCSAPAAERRSRCERILALIDACLDEIGAPWAEDADAGAMVPIRTEHELGGAMVPVRTEHELGAAMVSIATERELGTAMFSRTEHEGGTAA